MRHRLRAFQLFAPLLLAGVCVLFLAAGRPSEPSNAAERRIDLGKADPGSLYAVTVAVKDPAAFTNLKPVEVQLSDAQGVIATKYLHAQDLDFYLTMRPRTKGAAVAKLRAGAGETLPAIETGFERISNVASKSAVIAAAPDDTPDTAQPFEFGQTIFGGADDRPYAPAPGQDRYAALVAGFQWFRFTFHGAQPRLAYFVLDVTDREVPFDVDVFSKGKNDAIEPYTAGTSIYQIEATQNYPGLYKFRTRILQPGGTYYLRIDANHPSFQLHTFDYPVPPYTDPHQAVRTGMDFLVNMGDSWLSNTPRRGAVALRTT
ncbi:MAG: hypothetical protein WA324_18635, partial [Bryobacteraceae bacterium]